MRSSPRSTMTRRMLSTAACRVGRPVTPSYRRCSVSTLATRRQHPGVAIHSLGELRELERLLDEVVGARLDRLPLVGPIVERRDHDDSHGAAVVRVLLDLPTNLPAVAAGHH